MEPFLIYYGLQVLLTALSFFLSPDNKKRVFWVSAALLVAFVGLRATTVGTDTDNYIASFNHPEGGYGTDVDFGFLVLLYITNFLYANTDWLFILTTGILSLWGILNLSYRTSRNPVLSILLFSIGSTSVWFLFHYMSGIRQSMAESMVLLGFYYWMGNDFEIDTPADQEATSDDESEIPVPPGRNPIKAVIFMLLALSLHASSLVTIPLLFFSSRIRISRYLWVGILALSYVIGVQSFFSFQELVLSIFDFLGQGIGVLRRYSLYAVQNMETAAASGFFNPNLWPFTFIGIFCCLFGNDRIFRSGYFVILMLSIVICNLFNDSSIWGRLFLYGMLTMPVVFANVIEYRKNWIAFGFLFFISAYFIYRNITVLTMQVFHLDKGNVVVPYETFFYAFPSFF